jgi:tRNA (guanine26-N2/guanine27-N2)-dimethyltransferase
LQLNQEITTIIEGKTKILIPKAAIENKVPPRDVAFFNPRAKISRDFSIIAYSAFLKKFHGPKTFLDAMSGVGARGLRVANEISEIDQVFVNDLNPTALELGRKSAELNNLQNYNVSEDETCRFLSSFAKKGMRGGIVDIDPFGSPTRHLDCGIRATVHGGILSVTATDLQVLHGLFNDACKKKYYGTPIKTEYADEIAVRLILGCVHLVAARLDVEATPIFVENNMHYYRVYLRILNKADTRDMMGFISHCRSCGNREIAKQKKELCHMCNAKMEIAGPLWIGGLFEKEFLKDMLEEAPNLAVDKKCAKAIEKCILESDMPGCYYTLDEVAKMRKTSPASLEKSIMRLQENGFVSSPTSFNPTGFRTDCKINKILELFSS